MKNKILIAALFFVGILSHATTYYVSLTGNNANAGTSEGAAWRTLTYAVSSSSPVAAGDLIYVKAGNYGNENIVVQKSGTPTKPIVVKGYKTTPGDQPIILVNRSDTGGVFSSADMPLYTGTSRTTGVGIDAEDVDFVTFKNIQLTQYAYGFAAGGAAIRYGVNVDNMGVRLIGDPAASYSGLGLRFGSTGTVWSDNSDIRRVLVINAAAEGISITGSNNNIDSCYVYNNDNSSNARTDYFYFIHGNYNTVQNSRLWQPASTPGGNHGFTFKGDEAGSLPIQYFVRNIFRKCIAYNISEGFTIRHRGEVNNIIEDCEAYGNMVIGGSSSGVVGNGCTIRDGAAMNIIRRCKFINCASGIKFTDTGEDGGTKWGGTKNIVCNNIIINCYYGIDFNNASGVAGDAGDNLIANNTFFFPRYMISANTSCDSMRYVGNIIYGSDNKNYGGGFNTGSQTGDIIPNGTYTYWEDCDYYNMEGGMPVNFVSNTAGGISSNPLLVDTSAAVYNFRLQAASPCINTCDHIAAEGGYINHLCNIEHINPFAIFSCFSKYQIRARPHVWRDYNKTLCPVGTYADMGAIEYK